MKKVLFMFSMMLGSAAVVCAQDSTSVQDQPSSEYRTDESATQDQSTMEQPGTESTTQDGTPQEGGLTQDTTSQDMSQDETINQDQSGTTGSEQSGSTSSAGQSSEYTDKEMISTAELPSLVTEQLQSDEYSGWMVDRSYKKEKDGQTYYAVELKNGSETKMVKFDAQGNKVKEKDKGENHNEEHNKQ